MNQTAQGLASLGRGPDSMLVHMAPEEVAGLQALALKHGGTLTINPETGLAEAGFLKNILPMIAGFALGPAGFGLSSAMAGLTVGGISALTSGSLSKGLMAGLGAYGGSGLGESLMGAGTNALSSAGANAVVPPAAESIVPQAVLPAATNVAATNVVTAAPDVLGGTANELARAYGYPTLAAPTVPAINAAQIAPTVTQAPALAASAGPVPTVSPYGDFARFDRALSPGLNASPMDKLGAGFNAVTASPGAALEFAKANKMPLAALGIAALSPDDKKAAMPNDPGMIRPYTYARNKVPGVFDRTANDPMSSRERQYFNEQYTALTPYKAPGPEYMAVGGPVEDMSNGNNMAAYMGQNKFADGGSVGGYIFDPRTGLYTKPGGQGATTVSPTGGISGASAGAGGSPEQPLSPQTLAFLENEAKNPGARDARMGQVSKAIEGLIGFAVPGAGLMQLARDGHLTTLAGGVANFFDPPASQPNYGVPVDSRGMYSNNPMGLTSYESGRGNPAEQGSDTGGGAGIGGGDISGQVEGTPAIARGGLLAQGGISNLGDYSDGGRLLRGPGDGVSDDIPAMIGQKQQARLADGEFVVPARIVSELGNGSTEAGARQLYAMMDRVQKARKKTVGKDKVATNSRAARLLPA